MSRPVPEQLQELAVEVRDLEVLPAAAVRARGRSRARRQLAAVLTAGAVVAVAAGVTIVSHQSTPAAEDPAIGTASSGDAAIGLATGCNLTLPEGPEQVRIRVLDGGALANRLEATLSVLRTRGFAVSQATTGDSKPDGSAALRYGPAAIGAASLVRAEIHGAVTMTFDPTVRDDTIDLTLGSSFTRLATTTEINQNLVTIGLPEAPPECR
jgi:hypothetical protein